MGGSHDLGDILNTALLKNLHHEGFTQLLCPRLILDRSRNPHHVSMVKGTG